MEEIIDYAATARLLGLPRRHASREAGLWKSGPRVRIRATSPVRVR